MTVLEKVGHDIVSVFEKAAPVVEELQTIATPFENLYAPGLSQVINIAMQQIMNAEALGVKAANTTGSDQVKLASVISAIAPQVAPILAGIGVQSVSSTQYTNFVNALVAAMNAFETTTPSTTTTTATPVPVTVSSTAPVTGAAVVGK